jgi:hypothetical protein
VSTATLLLCVLHATAFATQATTFIETKMLQRGATSVSRTVDPAVPEINVQAPYLRHSGLNLSLDATGDVVWTAADEMGMMNNLGISDDGSVAAIDIDLNNLRLQVLNGQTGDLLYEVTSARAGWESVAVAGSGNYIAYATGDLLYLLPADNSTPVWISSEGSCIRVAISRDGQHILGLEGPTTATPDSIHVWSYSPVSGTPVWTRAFPYATAGYFNGAKYSADGTRLVITGRNHIWVVNPVDGSAIDDFPAFNTEKPASVSGNGHVITYGALNGGKLYVHAWDAAAQSYLQLWTYTFTGGSSNWCTATGVSEDGETIGAGSLQFTSTGYDGFFAVFETYGNGQPLWTPASMADYVADVAISRDGLTVAASSWGPLSGTTPANIQVFDKYNPTPFFTYSHPGSPNVLAMTPDGTRLLAGGKAVHNRNMGWGGNAFMFSLDLEGGSVTGNVTLQGTTDYSGVVVEIQDGTRSAVTSATGTYQIAHIPAGTYSVVAHKMGYTTLTVNNIQVTDGGTVPAVNFALDTVGPAPTGLTASQAMLDHIQLQWNPVTAFGRMQRDHDRRIATGEETAFDARGPVAIGSAESFPKAMHPSLNSLDELDDADSIHVWRSVLSGGPYTLVRSLPGAAITYSDTLLGLHPGTQYYYVISAVYPGGDSRYSAEAMGVLEDNYLSFSPTVPQMTAPVTFDGVLTPGEWTDAVRVDVSDVFGYDAQNTPGTAYLYMKYDDTQDLLLVAAEDHANTQLDTLEGIGLYVDDDHSGSWTYTRQGSEGNYWAYWGPNGGSLRYRSLSGGPYGGNYYVFPNPQMGFSVAAGYMTVEFAIPMGFHNVYDLALYGPNRIAGVGVFVGRRENGVTVFDGWWPQDVPSMPSNPDYFSSTTIPANLFVPPAAPTNIQVERLDNHMRISWTDPSVGIDNLPLSTLAGISIYRNTELLETINPGVQTFTDVNVEFGGWYDYSLSGYILEDGNPFDGPLSTPQGGYSGSDPELQTLSYDDGTVNFYAIVSGTHDGNRFGLKFEKPANAEKVYTIQLMTNSTASVGVGLAVNDFGLPGEQLVGPYFIQAPAAGEWFTFHVPGLQAPQIDADSFWVTIDWPLASPGDPGIAVDSDQPISGQSYYFMNSSGWVMLPSYNFMIRAGVGATISSTGSEAPGVVHQFRLMDNYPNPFNPETMIPFELSKSGETSLMIYNLLGQKVATLISGPQTAGYHVVQWNSEDEAGQAVSTGVYLVRLESDGKAATRKITLLR